MGCDPRHFKTDRDQQNKAKPSAADRHAAQAPALDQARGARKARRYTDAINVGVEGVEPRLQREQIGNTFVARDAGRISGYQCKVSWPVAVRGSPAWVLRQPLRRPRAVRLTLNLGTITNLPSRYYRRYLRCRRY